MAEEVESGSLQPVPRFPRSYIRTFQLPGWKVEAAASSHPSGAGTRSRGSLLGLSPGRGGAVGNGQRTQRA